MERITKRREKEVVEQFKASDLYVLSVEERHMVSEGMEGNSKSREEWKGAACWSGISEEYNGK